MLINLQSTLCYHQKEKSPLNIVHSCLYIVHIKVLSASFSEQYKRTQAQTSSKGWYQWLFPVHVELWGRCCWIWTLKQHVSCGREAKCKDHTMWWGGIPKTEYVYTEFPPWRRWHSDIDPVVGANTKTTVFSVSKKTLLQIDDHHQQHQYLKHLHHHLKFTSTYWFLKISAGFKVVLLVPCIYKPISQVTGQTWEIKMNFLCCKNVAAWKRNEEVHKLQSCQGGKFREYLLVTNATNIAQNTFPKYVRVLRLLFRSEVKDWRECLSVKCFNCIVCCGRRLWELD